MQCCGYGRNSRRVSVPWLANRVLRHTACASVYSGLMALQPYLSIGVGRHALLVVAKQRRSWVRDALTGCEDAIADPGWRGANDLAQTKLVGLDQLTCAGALGVIRWLDDLQSLDGADQGTTLPNAESCGRYLPARPWACG